MVAHATNKPKGSEHMHPFMRQIAITYRCALRFREKELTDTGLSGCQTPYLTALYRRPGISQEEMARELNVNKSSVTRQLSALEEKGYVERRADPLDKRSLLIFPTPKALELHDRIFLCYRDWSRYLTEDFSPQEQAELSRLMAKIAKKAEDYVKGGGEKCAPSQNT